MTTQELEKAVEDFFNNEDLDEGRETLREKVTTLKELRYCIAHTLQNYDSSEVEDITEALVSLW